jgi:hypothetical protein
MFSAPESVTAAAVLLWVRVLAATVYLVTLALQVHNEPQPDATAISTEDAVIFAVFLGDAFLNAFSAFGVRAGSRGWRIAAVAYAALSACAAAALGIGFAQSGQSLAVPVVLGALVYNVAIILLLVAVRDSRAYFRPPPKRLADGDE